MKVVYPPADDGTYDTLSRTSTACPQVSGSGGQFLAGGYSNGGARDQVDSTAEDLGLSSNEQANGLLDVAAAPGYDSTDDGTGSCQAGAGTRIGRASSGVERTIW